MVQDACSARPVLGQRKLVIGRKLKKKPKVKPEKKIKKFQSGERVIKKKLPRAFDEKKQKKKEKKKSDIPSQS